MHRIHNSTQYILVSNKEFKTKLQGTVAQNKTVRHNNCPQ